MKPERLKSVLPDYSLSARLAPLRQNLHRYLLTAPDAEVFYRHMMLAYMQLAIETGVRHLADFEKTWRLPGGPGFLLQETMAAIGWADGASLRVPLNLPLYSIIRYEEVRPPDPRRGLRPDHRRLDHRDRP